MKETGDETRASGRADAAATERVDARGRPVVLSPGAFDLFAASLEKPGHADGALLRLLRRKARAHARSHAWGALLRLLRRKPAWGP